MHAYSFKNMFDGLMQARDQTRAAKTVELFGWLMLIESAAIVLAPQTVARLLQLAPLAEQALVFFRIGGMLIGGLGILYVISGRLNAHGFVFASMIDRPLVPPVMATLWLLQIVPASLAIAFSILDFGSFLWTLSAWRADAREQAQAASIAPSGA